MHCAVLFAALFAFAHLAGASEVGPDTTLGISVQAGSANGSNGSELRISELAPTSGGKGPLEHSDMVNERVEEENVEPFGVGLGAGGLAISSFQPGGPHATGLATRKDTTSLQLVLGTEGLPSSGVEGHVTPGSEDQDSHKELSGGGRSERACKFIISAKTLRVAYYGAGSCSMCSQAGKMISDIAKAMKRSILRVTDELSEHVLYTERKVRHLLRRLDLEEIDEETLIDVFSGGASLRVQLEKARQVGGHHRHLKVSISIEGDDAAWDLLVGAAEEVVRRAHPRIISRLQLLVDLLVVYKRARRVLKEQCALMDNFKADARS